MDWTEALGRVIERTGHRRYADLCADDHPDRESWRRLMVEQATGEAATYPPLATRAANLAGAIGRVVGAAVRGEAVRVPAPVHDERLAICLPCEFNGAGPGSVRCLKCGCGAMKLELATERCPLDPPRWGRFPASPPPSPT